MMKSPGPSYNLPPPVEAPLNPEGLAARIYAAEQPVEDARREHLFAMANHSVQYVGGLRNVDDEFIPIDADQAPDSVDASPPVQRFVIDHYNGAGDREALYDQFMHDKKQTDNMGERMQMILEKYLGEIGFIELAMIEDPNDPNVRAEKKQEFSDLIDWLQGHGADMKIFKKGEDRCVHYDTREPVIEADVFTVLERYRNLCDGFLPLGNGLVAHFRVMKCSSFVVPKGTMDGFKDKLGPNFTKATPFVQAMDAALHSNATFIGPSLRTSYYMEMVPVRPGGEGDH